MRACVDANARKISQVSFNDLTVVDVSMDRFTVNLCAGHSDEPHTNASLFPYRSLQASIIGGKQSSPA